MFAINQVCAVKQMGFEVCSQNSPQTKKIVAEIMHSFILNNCFTTIEISSEEDHNQIKFARASQY